MGSPVELEVEFEVGGGMWGMHQHGRAPLLQADIKLPSVKAKFMSSFCSKHPTMEINSATGKCPSCDENTIDLVGDFLNYPERLWGQTQTECIDCSRIIHTHECRCYLGHECNSACPGHVPPTAHPLEQLAGAAPNQMMLSVYNRLGDLERDNAALKNLVTKLLGRLPKETVEAAAMDAIREKIGLSVEGSKHAAIGSTSGIENT